MSGPAGITRANSFPLIEQTQRHRLSPLHRPDRPKCGNRRSVEKMLAQAARRNQEATEKILVMRARQPRHTRAPSSFRRRMLGDGYSGGSALQGRRARCRMLGSHCRTFKSSNCHPEQARPVFAAKSRSSLRSEDNTLRDLRKRSSGPE